MKLKTSAELFLGLQEQQHIVEALEDKGYKRIIKSTATSFGVVQSVFDPAFDSLRVFVTGSNLLSIKRGIAIDKNINCIDVVEDLSNQLIVPGDNVTRFVVIKYVPTVIEQGTVNIQADGTVFGIDTVFTKRLRGIPNFPSKIKFPNSINNVGEYTILSVQDDEVASLNINQGQIFAENNQQYSVVGTFTPFNTIPEQDKFPFVGDSYQIELRTSSVVEQGIEFVLAEVINTGASLSVFDRRQLNLFSVSPISTQIASQSNPLIGVEKIMFDNTNGARDKNLMTISWGMISSTGQWGIDANLQKIYVSVGIGGKWANIDPMTTGDFDGWKVVFEATGQIIPIKTSTKESSQIVLDVDYLPLYPTTGSISITPNADLIEITVSNNTNPTADSTHCFASKSRTAVIAIQNQVASTVKFKHILSNQGTSVINNIGDGSYFNEDAFDATGTLTTPANITDYINGIITPKVAPINISTLINRILKLESKCSVFSQGGGMVLWQKPLADIPENWHEVVNWRNRLPRGLDPTTSPFNVVGNEGGVAKINLTLDQLPEHRFHFLTTEQSGVSPSSDANKIATNPNNFVVARCSDGGDNDYSLVKSETEQEPTAGLTSKVGANADVNILNPYRIVVFIEYIEPS